MDEEILFFFGAHLDALPVYQTLWRRVEEQLPQTRRKVSKTQISFYDRRMYACVSFLPVRPAALRPKTGWLTLTFGLNRRETDPRIDAVSEPYPGRWTHHVLLSSPEEVDGQIVAWLREAAAFSAGKR